MFEITEFEITGTFTPVLYCIILYCIALHCIALHCVALRCVALCCVVLCCVVVVLYCCDTQALETHDDTIQYVAPRLYPANATSRTLLLQLSADSFYLWQTMNQTVAKQRRQVQMVVIMAVCLLVSF